MSVDTIALSAGGSSASPNLVNLGSVASPPPPTNLGISSVDFTDNEGAWVVFSSVVYPNKIEFLNREGAVFYDSYTSIWPSFVKAHILRPVKKLYFGLKSRTTSGANKEIGGESIESIEITGDTSQLEAIYVFNITDQIIGKNLGDIIDVLPDRTGLSAGVFESSYGYPANQDWAAPQEILNDFAAKNWVFASNN